MASYDINAHVAQLGQEILTAFKSRIGDVKLSADEMDLIQRASERLAFVSVYSLGASDTNKGLLTMQRDAALATLENIGIAKAIQAAAIMREVANEIASKAIKLGLGLLAAAIAA